MSIPNDPVSPGDTQPSIHIARERAEGKWPWWSVGSLVALALIMLVCAGGSFVYAYRTPGGAALPTVILITVTSPPAPTFVVVTSAPTPAIGPSAARTVRVAGTQGLNLRIRSAPSTQAETVKLVPDGTPLLITGEGRQAEGQLWWPVRDPSDQKEGWAVSTYLVPDAGP